MNSRSRFDAFFPMRSRALLVLVTACLTACGTPTTPTDSGNEAAADVARLDVSSDTTPADAAIDVSMQDTGADSRDVNPVDIVDAARSDTFVPDTISDVPTADSGSREDVPTTCLVELGSSCSSMCPAGLQCNGGFCIPQGREMCGGFAGAPCTDATYTQCLYFAGADFGVCVSTSEETCLCMRARSAFSSCP